MGKKVIVGLSGGVDSSVAAYTLLQQGYEVIGVTMHVWNQEGDNIYSQAVHDAKKVADHLGIPHYVIDFTKEFRTNVCLMPKLDRYRSVLPGYPMVMAKSPSL